eukprot:scaffold6066_cov69-Phaeocystis_antarctica.AAC.4
MPVSPHASILTTGATTSTPRLCGKQGGSDLGQLDLRRLLSAPEHASGCPRLRPASANQPLGPLWPAIQALFSTSTPR